MRACGHAFVVVASLLLAITASTSQVDVTSPIKTRTPVTSVTGPPPTCPSRSINYITQTLPQQCLTTSWASKPTTQETSTPDGSYSTHNAAATSSESQGTIQPDASNFSAPSGSTTSATSHQQATPPASTASETIHQSKTTTDIEDETEADSPLDHSNFLSFEEWKRQNLAKAGQSADHLGTRAGNGGEQRRRTEGINNALDSIGEDSEIEIDFGGFVDRGNPPSIKTSSSHDSGEASNNEGNEDKSADEPAGTHKRGKDAGKTCKERSNYASFDCASTVLKTNPECKGSTAVLMENKDSYMLNTCSAKNKFFIVELCDDILIDTVVLANFEFFSSMFRTFRVSVSDRYPVKLDKWREIGTFEARNSREVQAFLVENPLIWARYLRVEFLTHYGNEYYCPVSLLRVHGTTMMEEFNHDVKGSRNDDDPDNEAGDVEEVDRVPSADVVIADALREKTEAPPEAADAVSIQPSSSPAVSSVDARSSTSSSVPNAVEPSSTTLSLPGFTSYNLSVAMQMAIAPALSADEKPVCIPQDQPDEAVPLSSVSVHISQTERIPEASSASTAIPTPSRGTFSTNENATKPPEPSKVVLPVVPDKVATQNKSEPIKSSNQTSASNGRAQSSSTQPVNPSPTTQESFFKSVHKRLQLLESNSTLSLQYIEEQSRILRDAFSKVEKRQLGKTTTFLETLNTTVLTELRDFRHQYDQIWQSTVLELSSQREQSQHEVLALSARLSLLADEIVFQKRMAIVQFGLILLCLGLIIFSRHSSQATYLELPPVVQNALHKSSANLSRHVPSFESPPGSPSSTRPPSRYGLFQSLTHRHSPSEESQPDDGTKSPSIEYSPPTPTSLPSSRGRQTAATVSDGDEHSSDFSPESEQGAMRQTVSSPSTPSGRRDEKRVLGGRTSLPPGAVTES